jgi:hypothetical protein
MEEGINSGSEALTSRGGGKRGVKDLEERVRAAGEEGTFDPKL